MLWHEVNCKHEWMTYGKMDICLMCGTVIETCNHEYMTDNNATICVNCGETTENNNNE
jgi:hypothetical protein